MNTLLNPFIVTALVKAMPNRIDADPVAKGALKMLKDAMVKIENINQHRKISAYDSARDALGRLCAS